MKYFFSQKISPLLKRCFVYLFGNEDIARDKLLHIDAKALKLIAHLNVAHKNILYVFDYQHAHIHTMLKYIKNKRDIELSDKLTDIAAEYLLPYLAEHQMFYGDLPLYVVAIPTTKHQLIKRGFNPAQIIAKQIAQKLSLPLLQDGLIQTRSIHTQKTLRKTDRLRNIHNSMRAHKDLKDKNIAILIVDDITTTGATQREAYRALKKAGVAHVIHFALAH